MIYLARGFNRSAERGKRWDEKNTREAEKHHTQRSTAAQFVSKTFHIRDPSTYLRHSKPIIMNANQQEDDDGEEVGKEEEIFQFGVPQPNSNDPPITYTVGALRPPRKHAENFITCIRDKSAIL